MRAFPPLDTCLPMLATRYIRLPAAMQLRIVTTSLLLPKKVFFTFINNNKETKEWTFYVQAKSPFLRVVCTKDMIYQAEDRGSSQYSCLAHVVGKDGNILDQETQSLWGRPRGTPQCLLRQSPPRGRNTHTEQDFASSLSGLLLENTVSVFGKKMTFHSFSLSS